MITDSVVYPIKFGGGLSTISDALNIADNQSPNCKNVHSRLERRNGFTLEGTGASGTTGNGIFDYWKDVDIHYMMCYISTYLYKIDVSANAFDGTLDAISFGTAMSDDKMEFEQFNDAGTNYLIMATHNRDKLQKYDGTTCTDMSADSDAPSPKYIKQWRGYLFCANILNYESRVYYNTTQGAIKDDGDWSATAYQDIRTHDGDFITALALLKGRLYTFKRNSIHRWTYLGGTPLFSIKTAVSGVGTVSSQSIATVTHPRYGEVLVFLDDDGRFYAFDGSQAILLSANIEDDNKASEFNLSRLNKIYLSSACGRDYVAKHWYVCWVPTTTYNNWCVIWDYYADAWWPFKGMDARCCGIAKDSGKHNLYFIQNDAKVQRFDYGDDDDGADIVSVYDTKKLNYGNQPILKSSKYLDFQFKNIGDYNINFQRKDDWATSWKTAQSLNMSGGGFILGTSLLGTGRLGGAMAVTQTVDIPTITQMEQFRLNTSDGNPPWRLYGLDAVIRGHGYGRSG